MAQGVASMPPNTSSVFDMPQRTGVNACPCVCACSPGHVLSAYFILRRHSQDPDVRGVGRIQLSRRSISQPFQGAGGISAAKTDGGPIMPAAHTCRKVPHHHYERDHSIFIAEACGMVLALHDMVVGQLCLCELIIILTVSMVVLAAAAPAKTETETERGGLFPHISVLP